MHITKDVINDLLPVYLAGEASADTRALVEEFLRADPSMAAEVKAHAARSTALLESLAEVPAPAPALQEKAAFERIREHARYRNQFFVFAMVFALLPFSFVVADGDVTWIMLRDNPKQAGMFLVASGLCWIARAFVGRTKYDRA